MSFVLRCQRQHFAAAGVFAKRAQGFTPRRCQSSYRRTRSRLNIKPDASFLPSKTEPHDHIIYNPPPSAPNVYHTPSIFLPKNDKRRQLYEAAQSRSSQTVSGSSESPLQSLPPPIRKERPSPHGKYHLTEADFEEMRRLRKEDPLTWSVGKLAKKFNCSNSFVTHVTVYVVAREQKDRQKEITEFVKSRWGIKRRVARENRALRKETWLSDS